MAVSLRKAASGCAQTLDRTDTAGSGMAAVSASDIFAVITGRNDHSARNVWQIRIRYMHSVGVDYNFMKLTNTIYKGILSLSRKSSSLKLIPEFQNISSCNLSFNLESKQK